MCHIYDWQHDRFLPIGDDVTITIDGVPVKDIATCKTGPNGWVILHVSGDSENVLTMRQGHVLVDFRS